MKDTTPEKLVELAELLNYACNEYIPRGYIQSQLQFYGVSALFELKDIKENE